MKIILFILLSIGCGVTAYTKDQPEHKAPALKDAFSKAGVNVRITELGITMKIRGKTISPSKGELISPCYLTDNSSPKNPFMPS